MTEHFTPYLAGASSTVVANADAYIPVRVPGGPRPDGKVLVYFPDGTGRVVDGRHLLRLIGEETQRR